MSFLAKSKKEVIKEFAKNSKDTGSPQVQCAVISAQINSLTEHLKIHKKDFSSKRGLLILVGKRRAMLDYLKSKSQSCYEDLIARLSIRK